jgi:hypothetical protein
MLFSIVALSFLTAGFLLASIFYVRRRGKPHHLFFLTIRMVLLAALLCALFEPVMTFDKLDTGRRIVPVLVDASLSMRLFHPDSVVLPFLKRLDSLGHSHEGGPVFKFYSFGDSLRACGNPASMTFSDAQSTLSAAEEDAVFRRAPFLLIVSDGNLSNASLPQSGLFENPSYYIDLPEVAPRPFLQTELTHADESVPPDSATNATMVVRGYAPARRNLTLACRRGAVHVFRKQITVDSGYFSDTVSVRLAPAPKGRFVYTVSIENPVDTLRSVLCFSQTIVPHSFVASIYSASPTMDRRFLANALLAAPQWRLPAPGLARPDALFLFDIDTTSLGSLRSLGPHGVAVFFGAFPCSTDVRSVPGAFALVPTDPYDTLFAKFTNQDMPPPSTTLSCARPFLKHCRTVLSAVLRSDNSAPRSRDTIPLLQTGLYSGHTSVTVNARGLWRSDFLSLSVAKERETPSLMAGIISFVNELIVTGFRDNLAVLPLRPELSELDSVPLVLLLPSEATPVGIVSNSTAPVPDVQAKISILSARGNSMDFHFVLGSVDPQNRSFVKLPPLGAGVHAFSCAVTLNGTTHTYSDTLFIGISSPELCVQAQNTVLLGQIAVPLRHADINSVGSLYALHSPEKRNTVTRHFQIRRTWILLLVIVGVLAIEWTARRMKGLE